uniref:Ovule protein n=1 Tax=Schistosoma curassoni TaxID=6186 RepID=A0A183KXT7_9TREM
MNVRENILTQHTFNSGSHRNSICSQLEICEPNREGIYSFESLSANDLSSRSMDLEYHSPLECFLPSLLYIPFPSSVERLKVSELCLSKRLSILCFCPLSSAPNLQPDFWANKFFEQRLFSFVSENLFFGT